jgi:hypothetical protein
MKPFSSWLSLTIGSLVYAGIMFGVFRFLKGEPLKTALILTITSAIIYGTLLYFTYKHSYKNRN